MKCIDIHLYYGKFLFPHAWPTIADILASMERFEVEAAIMMSAQAIQYDFVAGNAELAEAIAPYPNLYGYVYINMHYPELSLAEMEKYLTTSKFVGAKYNGEYSRAAASDEANREVFNLLEQRYQKPLLLHTWGLPEHGNAVAYSLPSQALALARRHPHLTVIMGHMGGTEWPAAIQAASQAPNLHTDMQSSYADRDKVAAAVRTLGAGKVLFGAGNIGGCTAMQKGAVLGADISAAEKRAVLYDNARRLFKL